MSGRTLIVTVCLAVVSAVAAWWTRPRVVPASERPPGDVGSFTLGIDPPSVTGVTVDAGGFHAALSGPDPWVLHLPREGGGEAAWPAEPDTVRSMLRRLASVRLTPGDEDAAAGGSPLAEIVVTDAGGRAVRVEPMGPPLAGRVPVRVTTPDGVRTADVPADRFRPMTIGELAALAAPRPFDVRGVFTSITITTADGAGFALRRSGGLWSLEGTPARVDQRAVSAMVASLRAIRMAELVVPMPADRINPRYTIVATVERPREPGRPVSGVACRLEIGEQANIEGDIRAHAVRESDGSTRECVISLDAETFPSIPSNPGALLDAVPLPFPAGDAGAVRIERGGNSAMLRKTLDGWVAGDRPADTPSLGAVLAALATPHPVSLHEPSGGEAVARLTVEPIGSGGPVVFSVHEAERGLVVSDGASDWVLDEPAFLAAVDSLVR